MSTENSPKEVIDLTGPVNNQSQNPGVEAVPESPTSSHAVGRIALSPFRTFAPDRPGAALGLPGSWSRPHDDTQAA